MRKPLAVGLAFVLWIGVGSNAIGQETKPQVSQEAKDKWESLTPEQKQSVKDRAKQKRGEKLTSEQKERLKKKWESLTPEQKEAMKEKARERATK